MALPKFRRDHPNGGLKHRWAIEFENLLYTYFHLLFVLFDLGVINNATKLHWSH